MHFKFKFHLNWFWRLFNVSMSMSQCAWFYVVLTTTFTEIPGEQRVIKTMCNRVRPLKANASHWERKKTSSLQHLWVSSPHLPKWAFYWEESFSAAYHSSLLAVLDTWTRVGSSPQFWNIYKPMQTNVLSTRYVKPKRMCHFLNKIVKPPKRCKSSFSKFYLNK